MKARIEIDGKVEFNGSTREWAAKTPDMFKNQINPDANPKPHLKAILIAFADAVNQKRSVDIIVDTLEDGWDMAVRYE